MAFCANCGHEISDRAPFCPSCGHPNEALAVTVAPARLAGFWIRFLSLLIDVILVNAVLGVFGLTEFRRETSSGVGFSFGLEPSNTLASFLYEWLMLGLNDGRTLGCMALGIRVAKPDGRTLGLGTAAARQGMSIVSAIALLIGYLWAAWDAEKRTWHDMVADTRVFRTR